MHNDPAGGVCAALRQMSVHMKNDKKETHDARKLKFSSIIHVRVVHHLADHTERAVLLECVDGVYLTQLTKMVQEALKQPKVRCCGSPPKARPSFSRRVFDQFAGEEWCVQPWVLHARGLSEATTRWRCTTRRAPLEGAQFGAIRRATRRNSLRRSVATAGTTPTPTARSTGKSSAAC